MAPCHAQCPLLACACRDPPQFHLYLKGLVGAVVRRVATASPPDSPNTDSIHLAACSFVMLHSCWLHGGESGS